MTTYDEFKNSDLRFINYDRYCEVLTEIKDKPIGTLESLFDKYAQLVDENERLIMFLKSKEIAFLPNEMERIMKLAKGEN